MPSVIANNFFAKAFQILKKENTLRWHIKDFHFTPRYSILKAKNNYDESLRIFAYKCWPEIRENGTVAYSSLVSSEMIDI